MLLTAGAFISVIVFSVIGEMVVMGIGNRILKTLRESFTKENTAA